MRRLASTLWLFHAGVVAALEQLLMVTLALPGLALLPRNGLLGPILIDSAGRAEISPLLPWTCLLLAVNSALTSRRVRARTAARIRQISRGVNPAAPNQITRELTVKLWLAVIAMAVLTLMAPPHIAVATAGLIGCPAIALAGWPALMSIGGAWFGGAAFAARQTLHTKVDLPELM
jgi:hypothetical protein